MKHLLKPVSTKSSLGLWLKTLKPVGQQSLITQYWKQKTLSTAADFKPGWPDLITISELGDEWLEYNSALFIGGFGNSYPEHVSAQWPQWRQTKPAAFNQLLPCPDREYYCVAAVDINNNINNSIGGWSVITGIAIMPPKKDKTTPAGCRKYSEKMKLVKMKYLKLKSTMTQIHLKSEQ